MATNVTEKDELKEMLNWREDWLREVQHKMQSKNLTHQWLLELKLQQYILVVCIAHCNQMIKARGRN